MINYGVKMLRLEVVFEDCSQELHELDSFQNNDIFQAFHEYLNDSVPSPRLQVTGNDSSYDSSTGQLLDFLDIV